MRALTACDYKAPQMITYKGKDVELPCIAASRGRNPYNPSSRIASEPTEQHLEVNTKGTSNTITTVQKDNYVICEQRCDEGLRFFKKDVCGTIRTKDSGGDKRVIEGSQVTRQDLCRVERMPLKFLNRNGKQTGEDYAFCVDTCHTGGIKEVYENNDFRIRKLTPRECFRLMGMNDCDIDKIQQAGISNSQQYKMAGNSIVVNVLEEIFRNLF